MYAIIETGGKQLNVEVGKKIYVEKLNANVGDTYTFDKIICFVDNEKVLFGKPYLNNVKVLAKVEKQGLSKKIHIFKYKPKHNERKRIGHRQKYTSLTIEKIICD
jgi:large subunit ribosomal protein L21